MIGLGNPLWGDDGIGVEVVRRLAADPALAERADWFELGPAVARLVHVLAGRPKAVLVDAARMGLPPGTLRRFTPAEARDGAPGRRLSLHAGGVWEALALSARLDECPPEVVLFGIEPARVAPGAGLSDALAARLPDYVAAVGAELAAVGAELAAAGPAGRRG